MVNQDTPASDTRTRLVLAAMRLFWEKGYNSTSIADVLHSAEVNSGSLYYFFPGKTDLLVAVLDMYHEGIRPMLLGACMGGRERSHRANFCAARALSQIPRRYRLLLWMSDRQSGLGTA